MGTCEGLFVFARLSGVKNARYLTHSLVLMLLSLFTLNQDYSAFTGVLFVLAHHQWHEDRIAFKNLNSKILLY